MANPLSSYSVFYQLEKVHCTSGAFNEETIFGKTVYEEAANQVMLERLKKSLMQAARNLGQSFSGLHRIAPLSAKIAVNSFLVFFIQ